MLRNAVITTLLTTSMKNANSGAVPGVLEVVHHRLARAREQQLVAELVREPEPADHGAVRVPGLAPLGGRDERAGREVDARGGGALGERVEAGADHRGELGIIQGRHAVGLQEREQDVLFGEG